MTPQAIARALARLTLVKKASDVLIMDLRGLTSMTDFFVLCSADTDIQVRAIADAVEEGMGKSGIHPWHREAGSSNWILLDYVDVVLHVFHRATRPFYNLERLWGDARMERIVDQPSPAGARTAPRRNAKRSRATPGKTSPRKQRRERRKSSR